MPASARLNESKDNDQDDRVSCATCIESKFDAIDRVAFARLNQSAKDNDQDDRVSCALLFCIKAKSKFIAADREMPVQG